MEESVGGGGQLSGRARARIQTAKTRVDLPILMLLMVEIEHTYWFAVVP